MTNGVEMFITQERLILLDTQETKTIQYQTIPDQNILFICVLSQFFLFQYWMNQLQMIENGVMELVVELLILFPVQLDITFNQFNYALGFYLVGMTHFMTHNDSYLVSHVVLVLHDQAPELNLIKLIQTAEMLKVLHTLHTYITYIHSASNSSS